MKYIDADLLKKEIKRRIEILKKAEIDWAEQGDTETSVYYSGKSVALDEFTDFIDSLQQEQQEEPDKSLEEAADICEAYYDVGEEHGYLYCIRGDIKNAFIAGAKWQTEHLKK